eukprot:4175021-Pyramimonas_sp.AAC.1
MYPQPEYQPTSSSIYHGDLPQMGGGFHHQGPMYSGVPGVGYTPLGNNPVQAPYPINNFYRGHQFPIGPGPSGVVMDSSLPPGFQQGGGSMW